MVDTGKAQNAGWRAVLVNPDGAPRKRSHHRRGYNLPTGTRPSRKKGGTNARRYAPVMVDGHLCEVCEVCQEPVGYWAGAEHFVPGGGRKVYLHPHCVQCGILVGPLHEQKTVNTQGLCEVCALPGMDQLAAMEGPHPAEVWPPEALVTVREGLNRGHSVRLL